jgi:hypothetical protein
MSVYVGKGKENLALLEDLPTEVLLVIFKYCTLGDLGSLCKTCKRLNSVVTNFIWYGNSRKALVTNQISPVIRNRYINNFYLDINCYGFTFCAVLNVKYKSRIHYKQNYFIVHRHITSMQWSSVLVQLRI